MPPPGEAEYDLGEDLKRRLTPHLEELGVEAFVIFGYAKNADGKTTRWVVVNNGNDAAYTDGLRPAILFAMGWGGHLARPADSQHPPHDNEKG
jgi:hypothetical protein